MIHWTNMLQIIIVFIGIIFQVILSVKGYAFIGFLIAIILNLMAHIMVGLYIYLEVKE